MAKFVFARSKAYLSLLGCAILAFTPFSGFSQEVQSFPSWKDLNDGFEEREAEIGMRLRLAPKFFLHGEEYAMPFETQVPVPGTEKTKYFLKLPASREDFEKMAEQYENPVDAIAGEGLIRDGERKAIESIAGEAPSYRLVGASPQAVKEHDFGRPYGVYEMTVSDYEKGIGKTWVRKEWLSQEEQEQAIDMRLALFEDRDRSIDEPIVEEAIDCVAQQVEVISDLVRKPRVEQVFAGVLDQAPAFVIHPLMIDRLPSQGASGLDDFSEKFPLYSVENGKLEPVLSVYHRSEQLYNKPATYEQYRRNEMMALHLPVVSFGASGRCLFVDQNTIMNYLSRFVEFEHLFEPEKKIDEAAVDPLKKVFREESGLAEELPESNPEIH